MQKEHGQEPRGDEAAPQEGGFAQFWNQQGDRGRALLAGAVILLFLLPCCATTFILSGDTIIELATLFLDTDQVSRAEQGSASATISPTPQRPTPKPTFTSAPAPTPTAQPEPTETITATPIPPAASRIKGRVVRVIDGGAIEVECDQGIHIVRYAGIDLSWPLASASDEEWARDEIHTANQRVVADREVYLVPIGSAPDALEEMSCYVWIGGVLVNAELVHRGYARSSLISADEGYHDLLNMLEQEARAEGRGLWQRAVMEVSAEETAAATEAEPSLTEGETTSPSSTTVQPTSTYTPVPPTATFTLQPTTPLPTATEIPTRTPTPRPTPTNAPTSTPTRESDTESECAYVGSANSDKYHRPDCRYAENILPENRVCFDSRAEAEAAGYVPCKVCKP